MADKETLRRQLLSWDEALSKYSLPAWKSFPALPLYMDQVVFLLNQYLAMLPEQAEEKQVTPAMINNYVKLRIVPPPVKKRYGRTHLAYLVVVCVCKQTLNTGDIKKLMPLSLSEEEAREVYARFIEAFEDVRQDFRAGVRRAAEPVFSEADAPVTHLLFRTAVAANLAKQVTEIECRT